VNSRQKGKRGEREWAKYLREMFGLADARRGVQYSGSSDSPDVVGGWTGTHAEVKRVERFAPDAWVDQAIRDAGSRVPYVAHRQNNKPWLVTIRAEDAIRFAKAVLAAYSGLK
jgi:hypothetical protein